MKDNEIKYLNAMAQARNMMKQGLITEKEFIKIENKMAEKYSLSALSLYRVNDLIISNFRDIYMLETSEVQAG